MSSKRKSVFSGKLLKVFTSERKLPNGHKSYLEEVKHPGAVLVIPFFNNKVVLIRQYRPVIDKYIWELPAGKLDANETPASCAKREMIEETGFKIKNLKRLGYIYTTPGFSDEIIYIYRAECGTREKAETEVDEIIDVKIMSVPAVRSLFSKRKIKDAKTICALSMAGIF